MEIIIKAIPFLIAGLFAIVGLAKAVGTEFFKQKYKHWNMSNGARILIGASEIITAGLLLYPPTQVIGAWAVTVIMTGAIAVLIIVSEYKRIALPLLFWGLAVVLLYQSNPEILSSPMLVLQVVGMAIAALLFAYPITPMNKEGEKEMLSTGVEVTHHFKKTLNGVRYHYVETGVENKETVVIVPGAPESWYAFFYVISALSEHFRVIALDLKGYGQTDADLDGNHSFEHTSKEIVALVDNLGIDRFYLMGHDRGTVATDQMIAIEGMNKRILKYVRMQQSFNEPHGDPVPPHRLMKSFAATILYKTRWIMPILYNKSGYVKYRLPKEVVQRLDKEFKFEGQNLKMPLSFKTTSFDKELKDRHDYIFEKMTMPTLILQGKHDPGQHPEEYENSPDFIKKGRVQFIEASHFFHLEKPKETCEAVLDFLK